MTEYETVEIIKKKYFVQLRVNAGGSFSCRVICNNEILFVSIGHRNIADAKLFAKHWLEKNKKI